MKINAVSIEFTLEEVQERLEETKATYIKHNILYYPYGLFEGKVQAKILTRDFSDHLSCWIDLVNETEAISAPIQSFEEIEIHERHIIKAKISNEGLEAKAKNYINFALFSKLKLLKTPKIDIIKTMKIYRPFYILQFQSNGTNRNVMVDGINGEHYLLRI